MLMLGSAYQNGLIPLEAENIINAIKLNGVGIDRNIYNFNLGRLYTFNPDHEVFDFLKKDIVKNLNSVELFEDRLERINNYDTRVVKDFSEDKRLIDDILSQEIDTETLTKDAIKELYRVYAIKDEYEVARMHIETTAKILDDSFASWNNLKFYLSPPMLFFMKDKRTGRPKKIEIPGYIAMPIFKLLHAFKFLRGTIFDPLNLSPDRIREHEHKKIFRSKLQEINNEIAGKKAKRLREFIDASKTVKGYGPVREKSYEKFKRFINIPEKKRLRLLRELFSFTSTKPIKSKKITSSENIRIK